MYEKSVHPLVGSCLDGYNVTVLAYGQTGSGKSFTMGSEDTLGVLMSAERRGLIPRYIHVRVEWGLIFVSDYFLWCNYLT